MTPPPPATRLVEICRVTPPPESTTQFSLPLTFFDTFWLKFRPVEWIFFYRLSAAAAATFQAAVLPRLKRSLSLALLRFLPIAGKLTWPADADAPFVLYSPGDGVSVTVAESTSADDDFDLLSGDGPQDAALSRPYVPKLAVSALNAAVLALQVTLFPNKGFCIGMTCHHAVLDGKSTAMFLQAWAHISSTHSQGWCDGSLPEELTPFLDRTLVKDPEGIALEDLKTWMAAGGGEGNPKSLELSPEPLLKSTLVRGTFKLSREDIEKLKQTVIRHDQLGTIKLNDLSTFVTTYAHTLVCVAKAKGFVEMNDKKAFVVFMADCRSRLDPPLPPNYLGNCILGFSALATIGELVRDGGIASAAHSLLQARSEMEKGVVVGAKGKLAMIFREWPKQKEQVLIRVSVAGSPRLGVYRVDFGYGRPEKVVITSIDGGSGMSMAESGDGSGGVEVGLVMEKHEMEEFTSAFSSSLL